jgi:hypothetical protein
VKNKRPLMEASGRTNRDCYLHRLALNQRLRVRRLNPCAHNRAVAEISLDSSDILAVTRGHAAGVKRFSGLVKITLHVLNWKVVRLHLQVHFMR